MILGTHLCRDGTDGGGETVWYLEVLCYATLFLKIDSSPYEHQAIAKQDLVESQTQSFGVEQLQRVGKKTPYDVETDTQKVKK